MLHERIADGAARTGDEIQRFLGNAGLIKDIDEFRGDRRRIAGRLEHHGVAGDKRRGDQPGHDGAREIPRRNDHSDAARKMHLARSCAGTFFQVSKYLWAASMACVAISAVACWKMPMT